MKHSIKITIILLGLFLLAQLVGIAVIESYSHSSFNLPFNLAPPKDITPQSSFWSIIFAMTIGALEICVPLV